MLEKTYQPAEIEARIHQDWQDASAFKAGRGDRAKADPYCIVIPPPNVTGSLHMGHALNNTLQDILCRHQRMLGRDVLWQPGTDHAGIATQLVVEKQLALTQQHRRDLDLDPARAREKFIEKVWAWKAESGGTIISQLKRLGASCDWSRERFTMGDHGGADEQMVQAVLKVFVELANTPGSPGPDGKPRNLIYKDKRLVNWDPEFQSAVSDLEVEQVEVRGTFKWTDGEVDKDGNPVAFSAVALNKALAKDPGGHMYHVRYPLTGKVFDKTDPTTFIVVATTRPETMLGDTGVAVHPEHPDKKLRELIGKECVLPIFGLTVGGMSGPVQVPIVGDAYADPEKGTGFVKITPAHDFNDWDVRNRCNLRVVNIFDSCARIIGAKDEISKTNTLGGVGFYPEKGFGPPLDPEGSDFRDIPDGLRGLDRFEARKKVTAILAEGEFLQRIEPVTQAIPRAQRGNAVIEPWLTDQWYVDAATLAKPAMEAVRSGKTRFIPEKYADDYFRWMENIQPWCISRQLWWGHRIPAWSQHWPMVQQDQKLIFAALNEQDALAQIKSKFNDRDVHVFDSQDAANQFMRQLPKGKSETTAAFVRDPDVLDTWFSSALWPFSTLGWPDETKELKRFYPNAALVTGFDIIFFWVARMMMMGTHFMADVPFRDVYIHALVLDEKGQKMSKSKGNVIDPLVLIDKYGADALRFTMAAMAAQGRNVRLSTHRVEGYRNFATKLWNAARFAEMNECVRQKGFEPKSVKQTLNRWIAGETERAVHAVSSALETYKFNDAATAAYEFTWGTFCDWYVELSKPVLNGDDEAAKAETRATTAWVLDQILKILHPFMPFITEELWGRMVEVGVKRETLLCLSHWPELHHLQNAEADAEIGWLISLISDVRSVRSEMNVPAGAKIPLVVMGAAKETQARAGHHVETIQRMARIDDITFASSPPPGSAQIVIGEATVCLPLAGVIDMGAEKARLEREIAAVHADLDKMNAKLANPAFMSRAKPEAIEETLERKAELEQMVVKLQAAVKRLVE